MTAYPPEECPRYARCSVNHCPLDPDKNGHLSIIGDKERVCLMEKTVRQRIGSKYAAILPLAGLTAREAAGARIWAKYPAAQQWSMREIARDRIKKINSRRQRLTK